MPTGKRLPGFSQLTRPDSPVQPAPADVQHISYVISQVTVRAERIPRDSGDQNDTHVHDIGLRQPRLEQATRLLEKRVRIVAPQELAPVETASRGQRRFVRACPGGIR